MKNKPQAVILAAGKGIRFHPLTKSCPKPLLKVLNKTILEHNLDQLDNLVSEVILVIGYQGEKIKNFFGNRYKNLKIKYIFQGPQLGTGDAAKTALALIKDKFLVLNGDDIYDREDIKKCLKRYPCMLLSRVENSSNFGVVALSKNLVKGIVEKPKKALDHLVNTGLYFLPKSILNFKIKKSPRGEYELTDYANEFIKKEKLFFVEAKNWYPLPYPWYLFEVNEFLLKKEKMVRKGKIEKNCTIRGKVIIGKGSTIKSGSYLQGPIYIGENCQIGPNCFLRGPISISSNCVVGLAVEMKNSLIGDDSQICHLSFVGDSIIGKNCNLAAGTVVANYRFDKKTVKVTANGDLIDTKREKFGCILGNNVKTGVNSSIMPGVIIGQNAIVGPNSLVRENIPDNTIFYTKFPKLIKKQSA